MLEIIATNLFIFGTMTAGLYRIRAALLILQQIQEEKRSSSNNIIPKDNPQCKRFDRAG